MNTETVNLTVYSVYKTRPTVINARVSMADIGKWLLESKLFQLTNLVIVPRKHKQPGRGKNSPPGHVAPPADAYHYLYYKDSVDT